MDPRIFFFLTYRGPGRTTIKGKTDDFGRDSFVERGDGMQGVKPEEKTIDLVPVSPMSIF